MLPVSAVAASVGDPQAHLQADRTGTGGAQSLTGLQAPGLHNATGEACRHQTVNFLSGDRAACHTCLLFCSGVYLHPELVTVATDSTGTDTGKPRPPDGPPDR